MHDQRNHAKKQTAREQGFPDVYLSENGNFAPGLDAAAKGDMCAALAGVPKDNARHDFSTPAGLKLAAKLIRARGWEAHVERKRQIVAEQRAAKDATAKPARQARRTRRKEG